MRYVQIPDDATAEEAAAMIAAIQAVLEVEALIPVRPAASRWVRAGRLQAQGLPLEGNERGWRVRLHV